MQINLGSKFCLQQAILIFGKKFQEKDTTSRKLDKMDISIEFCVFKLVSLCIKLHFEQTTLNFWTKFVQEEYL